MQRQPEEKGVKDMQVDSDMLPEVEVETGEDLPCIYTASDYILKEVERDGIVIPPKPAVVFSDSPYRKHSLWVYQEAAEVTRFCSVLLYLKIDNAKEEVKTFQEAFKEIIKEMDKNFIESQKEKAIGLKEYVIIEDRMYKCEIRTMDNKTHFESEVKTNVMIKTTLEEAGSDLPKEAPDVGAGVRDNTQQSNNEYFINRKDSLKKMIDDDLLFDAMITSRNVIIQQKIAKGETVQDSRIFSTNEEISDAKEVVIEQFSEDFAAITLKTIKDTANNVRNKHTRTRSEYKRKKRELMGLVDECTEYIMWADFLVANKDAIILKKKCEVLKNLAEELDSKAENNNDSGL